MIVYQQQTTCPQ